MDFLRRHITRSEQAMSKPMVPGSETSVGVGVPADSVTEKPTLASLKASLPTWPPIFPNTVL